MRKKRKPSEQQRELFADAPLLPDFEEAINDRLRDELLVAREARDESFRDLEGVSSSTVTPSDEPPDSSARQPERERPRRRPGNSEITKRLLARSADRDRRRAAVKQFERLTDSAERPVN